MMEHEIFLAAWNGLPERAKRMFKDFAKYPTDRNSIYAVGYLAALNDNHLISHDTYKYWLVASGQMGENDLCLEIKEVV